MGWGIRRCEFDVGWRSAAASETLDSAQPCMIASRAAPCDGPRIRRSLHSMALIGAIAPHSRSRSQRIRSLRSRGAISSRIFSAGGMSETAIDAENWRHSRPKRPSPMICPRRCRSLSEAGWSSSAKRFSPPAGDAGTAPAIGCVPPRSLIKKTTLVGIATPARPAISVWTRVRRIMTRRYALKLNHARCVANFGTFKPSNRGNHPR